MTQAKSEKTIVVSGIRASGKLHIGNYLGALKQFIALQNQPNTECYFFVADLHGMTTPFTANELKQNTLEVVAEYIAAGLDPKKVTLFLQSQVPAHTQLAWVFNCITPLAELERMTQFKDKSKSNAKNINAGLLTYPALMAADILLYKPNVVPVGEDQMQHIELTRIIARKFNHAFGEIFPEPHALERKLLRIKSLTNPEEKMSKSSPAGALWLSDTPEVIEKKLAKAVTGGFDSHGVHGLVLLLNEFGTPDQIKHYEAVLKNQTIRFSELKKDLAVALSEHFAEFRMKKEQLLENPKELEKVLIHGAKKAREQANKTIAEVYEKTGLI